MTWTCPNCKAAVVTTERVKEVSHKCPKENDKYVSLESNEQF